MSAFPSAQGNRRIKRHFYRFYFKVIQKKKVPKMYYQNEK